MTKAEWLASTEPADLLRHAVPLIPRQHLCLVLSEVALRVWPNWHCKYPSDWRPAWSIAVLRAWCFGEATLDEVRFSTTAEADFDEDDEEVGEDAPSTDFRRTIDGFDADYADLRDGELSGDAASAAATAIARMIRAAHSVDPINVAISVTDAAAFSCASAADDDASDALYDVRQGIADDASDAYAADDRRADAPYTWADFELEQSAEDAETAAEAKAKAAYSKGYTASQEQSAIAIRAGVPHRTSVATDWQVEEGVVVLSGGAMLRLEGRRLADAVMMVDLPNLGSYRAVAFDWVLERSALLPQAYSPQGKT